MISDVKHPQGGPYPAALIWSVYNGLTGVCGAVVATFKQQNQTVNHQINAETVHVGGVSSELATLIGQLIAQQPQDDRRQPAHAALLLARQAAQNGDTPTAAVLLRRIAETAGPVSALATGIAAILQAL